MDYYEQNLQKKKEIENGLLELMQRVPFQQITVTDLARHMGMSRKSFYHYFSNREACLESLMDRMIQEAALHVATTSRGFSIAPADFVINLEYWRMQQPFLNAVAQNQLHDVFLERHIRFVKDNRVLYSLLTLPDAEFDEDVLHFYASGHLSILMRWLHRDFTPPAEEMACKYLRLLCTPLIQPEEK